MREGLTRVVEALTLAAVGLDQLFERKGIKSHMMPNPDGHPWIRVMHPMDEVRFIGITPNRGDGPIYLKLRIFLYDQYTEEIKRLLTGKFFTFDGAALLRNRAYPGPSWLRYSFVSEVVVRPESASRRLTTADLLRQIDAATTAHVARMYASRASSL